MLGISASTLFKAAIIPGLLILLSILVTNIIVSRKMAKAEGQLMSFGEWAANLGRVLGKGWYAFMIPGIIFYGIFSGRLTPTESRCCRRQRDHRHGVPAGHAEDFGFPVDG